MLPDADILFPFALVIPRGELVNPLLAALVLPSGDMLSTAYNRARLDAFSNDPGLVQKQVAPVQTAHRPHPTS